MTYVVLILRRAEADIDSIKSWIESHAPAGAEHWFEACANAILTLEDAPLSYALAEEGGALQLPLRERFFKTPAGRRYRVLFVVAANQVRILRIRGPGQPPVTWDDLV
jgi:plasmid stabilization system protein ParE